MDNESIDRCQFKFTSLEEFAFKFEISATFLFSLFGFLANACQLWLVSKMTVWPINVRLLLANINAAALFTNLCGLLRFFYYDIRNLYSSGSGVLQEVSTFLCQLHACSLTVCCTPLAYSLPAIAVERWLVSTNRMSPSEDKPHKLIALAVIGSWLVGLFVGAGVFVPNTPQGAHGHNHMCYCTFFALIPSPILLTSVGFFVAQELLMSILFYYILHFSRTKLANFCLSTATHSLNDRFETKSTIRITEMVFPSVLLQTVIWSVTVFWSVLVILKFDFDTLYLSFDPTKALSVEPMITLVMLHTALHPVLLLVRGKTLRKKFLECVLHKVQQTPVVGVTLNEQADGDRHLEIVQSIWNDHHH